MSFIEWASLAEREYSPAGLNTEWHGKVPPRIRNITKPGRGSAELTGHFLSFFNVVGTLTSRLSRFHLHFDCNSVSKLFVELDEFFGDLYFASLRTLEFKFEFEDEPVSHYFFPCILQL